jgi:hypothetical protein
LLAAERRSVGRRGDHLKDDIDNLFAIAEIAGVFIGFAALVTVVAKSGAGESEREDTFMLASVVITNVMIITAALFPVVLSRYGLSPAGVWRISSGYFWVLNLLQIAFLSRTTQGYSAAFSRRRILRSTMLLLSPFFHVPLLLCIFGIFQDLAPALFLTAIVAAVFQSSLLFADLVISIIVPDSMAR